MSATRYGAHPIAGFCPIHEWDVSECDIACHRLRPAFILANEALAEYWNARECGVRPTREYDEDRLLNLQRGRMVMAEKRHKAA